jgi:hypothetical protein
VRKVRQILRDGKGINVKYNENKTIGVGLEKNTASIFKSAACTWVKCKPHFRKCKPWMKKCERIFFVQTLMFKVQVLKFKKAIRLFSPKYHNLFLQ